MAVEAEELYSNLNTLLNDICKFLKDGANYEKLSPYARKQADELIKRSKKQLQDIEKIQKESEEYAGAYVDMERKSEGSNEDDKNIIYTSLEEVAVIPPPVIIHQPSNPYANLPAKDLCQDVKFGALSWKCRFILKFEKVRRIYAGIHDNWLLVYSSEKDYKPLQAFDLKFHKAEPVVSKQNKTVSQDFELSCSLGERKTYYFLALTHKDMLQWISHINNCNDNLNKCDNLSVTEGSISETYNEIPEVNKPENNDIEEEEIYHEPETYSQEPRVIDNKPPELPARRSKTNVPLPPIPQRETYDDSSSMSSTYDPVQSTVSLESNNSFSEDDEDNIYEPFVSKPPEPNPVETYVNNVVSNQKVSTEKPKTPAKPKIFPDKGKLMLLRKQI